MNEPTEPANPTLRPIFEANSRDSGISVVVAVLASGWLIVPAVQYFATAERTRYQLGEVEAGAQAPPMVEWDLTPFYLLLVFLTALFCLRAYLVRPSGDIVEVNSGPFRGESA